VGAAVVEVFATVAVNVTTLPQFDGFSDEMTETDVAAELIVKLTEELLLVWFWSPPYVAVAVALPAFRLLL
jgi:hypothetical protein